MLKMNCVMPRLMLKAQKISYGKGLRLVGWPFVFQYPAALIRIGSNVTINSNFWSNFLGLYQRTIIVAKKKARIVIGDHVGMSGCTIYAWEHISIGDHTMIGANVKIVDNDFHPVSPEARLRGEYDAVSQKPVKIGKNVFIGMNSIILKGSVIGDNCVVGAGSVVCGKFPSDCVIAGNPAKVVRAL